MCMACCTAISIGKRLQPISKKCCRVCRWWKTVPISGVFAKAGRQLAELHLHYENYPKPNGVVVHIDTGATIDYEVVKMRFPRKGERHTILYNHQITIENIPAEAYEYVVNGKSAIEWIMERYQVTTNKDSGIVNDPNDWAREQGNPKYILDLLLSIINVSLQTVEIVRNLPALDLGDLCRRKIHRLTSEKL
jgi:predicted helicase